LSEAEQVTTGVTPDLVRLCIGLESIEDIIADLEAGFRAIKGA
jgi:O-acetylhomoserine (thiol)-lyase